MGSKQTVMGDFVVTCPVGETTISEACSGVQSGFAAEKESLVARHVDFREGHVRRPDLERHDEISEGGKGNWNDAEEDHDRAMHGA